MDQTNTSLRPFFFLTLFISVATAATLADESGDPASLAEEVAVLRSKVAALEAAISSEPDHSSADSSTLTTSSSGMSMGGMKNMPMKKGMGMMMSGMGGMGMMKGGMSSMTTDSTNSESEAPATKMSMPMKGMMKNGMGKMMMGMAPDPSMAASSLPGFPGASHLYHIGSTNFFLDHSEHIQLDPTQSELLNELKSSSVMSQNKFDREAEQLEQELWILTASAQPDASKIKEKLDALGKLSTEKRLSFITAVGEAAELLTDPQRQLLTDGASSDMNSSEENHAH